MTGFAVGAILALLVGGSATFVGLDRDRALYPAVAVVVASYYVLFAVIGGSTHVLLVELAVAVAFVAAALASFRSTLWVVVAALAAHGVFDLVHPQVYRNPGVPVWWPSFCMAYDVVAAVYLAARLAGKNIHARAA